MNEPRSNGVNFVQQLSSQPNWITISLSYAKSLLEITMVYNTL